MGAGSLPRAGLKKSSAKNLVVVLKIFTAAGGFFILWMIFYFTVIYLQKKARRSKLGTIQFPLPVPTISEEKLNYFSKELEQLGFSLKQKLSREQFKLWPSPCWNFTHEKSPCFADLTIFPTRNILILFFTLFEKGAVITAFGERESSIHFFPGDSKIHWEPGKLSEVWNAHKKYTEEYETSHHAAPFPLSREKYAQHIKNTQNHLIKLLNEENLTLRTVGDYLVAGYLYLNELKTAEALEMFQGAINLFPDSSPLYSLAGKVALHLSKYDDAVQYFYEALDLDPYDQESYLLLSDALIISGKKKIAYNLLKKGVSAFPNNADIKLQFGILAVDLGYLDEAKPVLLELEGNSPHSFALYNTLSIFYQKSGNSKKAVEYSQSAKMMQNKES